MNHLKLFEAVDKSAEKLKMRFIQAIKNVDIPTMRQMIADGFDISQRDYTVVTYATAYPHRSVLRFILSELSKDMDSPFWYNHASALSFFIYETWKKSHSTLYNLLLKGTKDYLSVISTIKQWAEKTNDLQEQMEYLDLIEELEFDDQSFKKAVQIDKKFDLL